MLHVNICGIDFKNPVIAASGTFGFGNEYSRFYDVSELGGICTKGLTLNKREGNDGIRVYETRGGMLNSVGLQNPGIESFISDILPSMKKLDTVIIANLSGGSMDEYVKGASMLSSVPIDIIELNISCPNVKHGGMAFGIKCDSAFKIVKEVREVCEKPLMVKLSPNAENISDMACACVKAGADAISLVNTFKGMAVDIKSRKAVFKNITAGFSGPAIKPIALRMVYEVCKAVDVPVVGLGGITCWSDAAEFIMAGASAIEIGTVNFINPFAGKEIIKGLENYMQKEGIRDLSEIRGII